MSGGSPTQPQLGKAQASLIGNGEPQSTHHQSQQVLKVQPSEEWTCESFGASNVEGRRTSHMRQELANVK